LRDKGANGKGRGEVLAGKGQDRLRNLSPARSRRGGSGIARTWARPCEWCRRVRRGVEAKAGKAVERRARGWQGDRKRESRGPGWKRTATEGERWPVQVRGEKSSGVPVRGLGEKTGPSAAGKQGNREVTMGQRVPGRMQDRGNPDLPL